MSILAVIITVILVLVALFFIVALFTKKAYAVERSVVINRPQQEVFEFIRYLKNQDQYSVWNNIDPGMKKTYQGTDGNPGFMYAWDSNNKKAGKGEQEIVSVEPNKQLNMRIHFIKPFEGLADAYMRSEMAGQGQTRVSWGLSSTMKYPMNIMLAFINMDTMLGKDLATSLQQLKTILEK
ncbi:MAG TPA: SRPBCC family protein [Chitinophagaceae bacterium]|nr:SRPBCC family protein [Chitinophagaceae bacterium]